MAARQAPAGGDAEVPAGQADPTIFNPGREPPARQLQVCQQCHLQGQATVLHGSAGTPTIPASRWPTTSRSTARPGRGARSSRWPARAPLKLSACAGSPARLHHSPPRPHHPQRRAQPGRSVSRATPRGPPAPIPPLPTRRRPVRAAICRRAGRPTSRMCTSPTTSSGAAPRWWTFGRACGRASGAARWPPGAAPRRAPAAGVGPGLPGEGEGGARHLDTAIALLTAATQEAPADTPSCPRPGRPSGAASCARAGRPRPGPRWSASRRPPSRTRHGCRTSWRRRRPRSVTWDAARRTLEAAVARPPDAGPLAPALGCLLRGQGRLAEARSAFDAALRLTTTTPPCRRSWPGGPGPG
ncbi:MAG: hypothetical protein R3F43_09260 [bacterium]